MTEVGKDANSAGRLLMRLVNLVSHRSGKTFALMNYAGVTLQQIVLLSRIEQLGSASLSDVAQSANTSGPAASQMIDRLVQQGLLHRVEDPDDRRRKSITLSADARTFLRRFETARSDDFEAGLAPLSPELRAQMATMLEQAVAEIERVRTDDQHANNVAKEQRSEHVRTPKHTAHGDRKPQIPGRGR